MRSLLSALGSAVSWLLLSGLLLAYCLLWLTLGIGILAEFTQFATKYGENAGMLLAVGSMINADLYLILRLGFLRRLVVERPLLYMWLKLGSTHANLLAVSGSAALLAGRHLGGNVWICFLSIWLAGRLLMCWYYHKNPISQDLIDGVAE